MVRVTSFEVSGRGRAGARWATRPGDGRGVQVEARPEPKRSGHGPVWWCPVFRPPRPTRISVVVSPLPLQVGRLAGAVVFFAVRRVV
ncbi:hypothetical protein SANTM175S_09244 [Streptomyces antimycoticus]